MVVIVLRVKFGLLLVVCSVNVQSAVVLYSSGVSAENAAGDRVGILLRLVDISADFVNNYPVVKAVDDVRFSCLFGISRSFRCGSAFSAFGRLVS